MTMLQHPNPKRPPSGARKQAKPKMATTRKAQVAKAQQALKSTPERAAKIAATSKRTAPVEHVSKLHAVKIPASKAAVTRAVNKAIAKGAPVIVEQPAAAPASKADFVAPNPKFDVMDAVAATGKSINALAKEYAGPDGKVAPGARGFNPSQIRRLAQGASNRVDRARAEFLAEALNVPFAKMWVEMDGSPAAAPVAPARRSRGRQLTARVSR
jgi:hypothetical protein